MVVVVVVVVVVTVAVVSGRNRALILRTQSKVFPIHTRSLILIFDSFCDARARRSLFYFFFCFFFWFWVTPLFVWLYFFFFFFFSSMYLRLVSFRGCGDCRSLRSLLFLLLRRRDNESPNKHTPVSRENPFDEFHR